MSELQPIGHTDVPELASEAVVIEAPMSLTGLTRRTMYFYRAHPVTRWWSRALAVSGLVLWFTVAYAAILCWYGAFGLWLVPYRVIRRGQRKRELQRRQHAELLAAMGRQNGSP